MKISNDMAGRFLTWPVPADVYPGWRTRQAPGRTGTNLLTAGTSYRAMLEHVLASNEPAMTRESRAASRQQRGGHDRRAGPPPGCPSDVERSSACAPRCGSTSGGDHHNSDRELGV